MSALDKHDLYGRAVQSPPADVRLYRELVRELTGRAPKRLREDFCGTFRLCCAWAALGPGHTALGRDLDPGPLAYGAAHDLAALTPEQRARVKAERKDALSRSAPADLILALNFSYFALKKRAALKKYLVNARKSLRPGGALIVDAFGGPGVHRPNREKTDHGAFVYYWEQYGFDPVTHEASCAMHFKLPGRRKVKDVFTYDWRLWTIAETRELMAEAGFSSSTIYWQDDDGRFARDENGGREEVWLALIAAVR